MNTAIMIYRSLGSYIIPKGRFYFVWALYFASEGTRVYAVSAKKGGECDAHSTSRCLRRFLIVVLKCSATPLQCGGCVGGGN